MLPLRAHDLFCFENVFMMGAPFLDSSAEDEAENEEEQQQQQQEPDFYEPISTDDEERRNSEEPVSANGFTALPSSSCNGNGSGSSETTIRFQGMEIHVVGNLNGLENFLANTNLENGYAAAVTDSSDEEEEEEEKRLEEAERAIQAAERADFERRNAPLQPETRSAIMDAMRGISLENGFRPSWADAIPEQQWIDQLRTFRQFPGRS